MTLETGFTILQYLVAAPLIALGVARPPMTLEERIAKALGKHNPIAKKMFGGTCFMLNGNMVIGTFKDGILARVGKDARHALNMPGVKPFEMRGRVMAGYVMVAESELASDAALANWIDLCLAFNTTLPAKMPSKAIIQKGPLTEARNLRHN